MAFFDTGTVIYILIFAFIFGAVLGSAMNCLALRIVRHEKWGGKSRSKCPVCGHTLGVTDLIPVFSYLFLKGKCRYCKTKISPRYLITELILGTCFVLVTVKALNDISDAFEYFINVKELYSSLEYIPDIDPSSEFRISLIQIISELFLNLLFSACLFSLSLADMESFEIPDRFILIPAVFRLIYVFLFGSVIELFGKGEGLLVLLTQGEPVAEAFKSGLLSFTDTLISGLAVGAVFLLLSLFMDRLLKKDSLGGGDIKLFSMTGLYLRPAVMLICILFSCIFGLLTSLISIKRAEKGPEGNHGKESENSSETESEEAGETCSGEDTEADDNGDSEEADIPEGAFPFGPAVSAAAFICILYGEKLLSLYLSLTGLGS